jgi:hypothetical protein
MGAANQLVALATKLWRAMEYALPKLPEATQVVLNARVEDGDVRWALALVLAGWRLGDKAEAGAADIDTIMEETGATALVRQISSLQMLLPDSFTNFVNAAKDATEDHQLAGSATYLADAVKDLGDTPRNTLHAWLRGVQFQEVGRALIRRFPVPGSGRPPVWGSPPPATSPAPPSKPSRVERFDRADFTPRQSQPRKMDERPRLAASSATPLRPPTPVLNGEAVSRSYLFTVGWEGAEVERLMSGPSGPAKKSSA